MLIPGIIPSLALYVQGLNPQENGLFPSPGFRAGGQRLGNNPRTDVHAETRVWTCVHLCVPTCYVTYMYPQP